MQKKQTKGCNFSVRVPDDLRLKIREAAEFGNMDESDVVRMCIRHALPIVVEAMEFFQRRLGEARRDVSETANAAGDWDALHQKLIRESTSRQRTVGSDKKPAKRSFVIP